ELGYLMPVAGAVQLHDAGAGGDGRPFIRLSHAWVTKDARDERDSGEESQERGHDDAHWHLPVSLPGTGDRTPCRFHARPSAAEPPARPRQLQWLLETAVH